MFESYRWGGTNTQKEGLGRERKEEDETENGEIFKLLVHSPEGLNGQCGYREESQELHPGLTRGWQGTKYLSHVLLLFLGH